MTGLYFNRTKIGGNVTNFIQSCEETRLKWPSTSKFVRCKVRDEVDSCSISKYKIFKSEALILDFCDCAAPRQLHVYRQVFSMAPETTWAPASHTFWDYPYTIALFFTTVLASICSFASKYHHEIIHTASCYIALEFVTCHFRIRFSTGRKSSAVIDVL